jgi:hypothetical protein
MSLKFGDVVRHAGGHASLRTICGAAGDAVRAKALRTVCQSIEDLILKDALQAVDSDSSGMSAMNAR